MFQHVSEDMLKNIQIKYNKPNADSPKASLQWSNAGGIVAYRDNKVLPTILECLRNS